MNSLPTPLVVAVDQEGRTVLVDGTAPQIDDAPRPFAQDRLFTPVQTMPGQLTMEQAGAEYGRLARGV